MIKRVDQKAILTLKCGFKSPMSELFYKGHHLEQFQIDLSY